ncbi:MAG TPA: LysM domain-containing protein [Chloroflexota bacterium]
MDPQIESVYAHVDQPAFEQMQIDQNISRLAIFFVCFLTLGVFYFTLVNFPISKLLPIQQLEQAGQLVNSLNPAASRAPTASARPSGALGGSQIGASAAPSPGTAPSTAPSASAAPSTAPSASASAAALSGGSYTVQAGDTLTTIARKFNIAAQSIADANKMQPTATLQVGQKLTIPK